MNKEAPLVSVIIPVYMVEEYIHQCVDSVLGQTYEKMEVILVDDGSQDRSGIICDEYAVKDSRVRVIHKENGGLVSARKAGAAVCTGDYVLCVDSDDYIDSRLLEHFVTVIADCTPDVITFNCTKFTGTQKTIIANGVEPGLYIGESLAQIHEHLIMDKDGKMSIIPGLALKMIRREQYVAYQMRVPVSVQKGEDLAVTAPLMAHCESIYVSDYCGYYYRCNPKSISNTFTAERCDQLKELVFFLDRQMGASYQDNLDRYTARYAMVFMDSAMAAAESYAQFRNLIRGLRDKEMRARIRRACMQQGDMRLRDRVVQKMKKNGYYLLYWGVLRGHNLLKFGRKKHE